MAVQISEDFLCQIRDQLLNTDLAMEWIFKLLRPQSLLTCRKVSRLFLHYANQVLRYHHSDSLKITFMILEERSPFTCTALINGIRHPLSDLTELMKSSPNFPCFNFKFRCSLRLKDLQEFLNCHGHRVIHIQFNVHFQLATDESMISTLRNLLAHQAPFIETLVLEQGHSNYFTNPHISALRLFPPQCPQYRAVTLARLKKLVLKTEVMDSVVKGIVGASPNLQHVTYIQHPTPFIQLNRLHVLKELLWEIPLADDGLRELDTFDTSITDSNLKLHAFGVYRGLHHRFSPEFMSKASSILLKILRSTADTLRDFYLMTRLSAFPNLQSFPQLPNVRILALTWRNLDIFPEESLELFPPDLSLPWTFPHLVKIIVWFYKTNMTDPWHECFTEANLPGPLLSVRSIEFGSLSCCPQGWLDQFSRVCPNVESIEINNYRTHFPEAAPDLWKFEHLKRLKIIIHAQDKAITSDYAIDAAFTGFSEDTCRELFSEGLRGMSCEDLELCRVRPSIVDIKALSRLEVTFVTNAGDRATVWRVMTKVTFLYALHKCPNLTDIAVTAAGSSREHAMTVVESLESISSFVPIHVRVMTERDWWPEDYDTELIMT